MKTRDLLGRGFSNLRSGLNQNCLDFEVHDPNDMLSVGNNFSRRKTSLMLFLGVKVDRHIFLASQTLKV